MKNIKVLVLCIIIVAIALTAGCYSYAGHPENVAKDSKSCKEISYRNGVYFFECTSADFANGLSGFIGEHPDLKLISFAPDPDSGKGYIVVFEKRPTEASVQYAVR